MKNLSILIKTFLIITVTIISGFSHAHIFIDYKVHACINESGFDGVFINWTYDRMTAQAIEKEFDLDKNKKFSKEELKKLYQNFFLKNYSKEQYFAIIEVNNKNYSIPKPVNFSARFDTKIGTIAFTFFLPLKIQSTKKMQNVHIHFLDPVIYVAFTILKKDISIQNKSNNVDAKINLKLIKYANHPIISFKERN